MKLVIVFAVIGLFLIVGCAAPQEAVMEEKPAEPVVQEAPVPEVVPEQKVEEKTVVEEAPVAEAESAKQEVMEEKPAVKEFVIEGDDKGLYPNAVTVKNGDAVKLTFKVRKEGTYFGGLDFRSTVWGDTAKVKPGESKTVEFTATETFEFKSYWPASNKLKATGKVMVE